MTGFSTEPKSEGIRTLGELSPGSRAVVGRVLCDRPVARRLMEMGLLPGTPVTVTRVAPLGDPIELRVRGYSLSVRRRDASHIEVTDVRAYATKTPVGAPEGSERSACPPR